MTQQPTTRVRNAVRTGTFLGRIPYIRGGAGEKTAVVFFGANALFQSLHSARPGDYARMVEAVLPRGYAFYILGYDAEPPADFGFSHIVRDFADIVREATGPATIIGVSFGGFVAQRFAAEHPGLVDNLVLLISAHRFSAEGWRKVLREEALIRSGDVYGFMKDIALLFRRPWYNWMLNAVLWQGRERLASRVHDSATLLRVYDNLFADFDNRPYVERIRAPALVVAGTRDQFFDVESLRETAALIPRAQLHLFPGETHMLPLERSAAVRRVISGFIGSTGSTPR